MAAVAIPRQPISKELNDYCWRNGVLYHLLDSLQQQIYEWWWSPELTERVRVAMIGRRVGKTFTFGCIASEIALRNPGSQQHYAAPTAKQVRDFLIPNFRMIFETAPEGLEPIYNAREGAFLFKNGSKIIVAGCEDMKKAERLRGAYTDCGWIDEAGYNPVLRHVALSILLPMCHNRQGAMVTCYSNAPMSPSHDIMGMADRAKARGAYYHATIYDSPRYSEEDIALVAEEQGGVDTSDFQREYMANCIVDEESSVIPEWQSRSLTFWVPQSDTFRAREATEEDDLQQVHEPLIREVPRPQYYDCYTFMDHGFNDILSIVAAYWDFEQGWLVAEGERELHRPTTDMIAAAVEELEQETWGHYWKFVAENHGWDRRPYKRVADAERKTLVDLQGIYGLPFVKAHMEEIHTQVKRLRGLARRGHLVINPRCENLIAHLDAATWNLQRTAFARPSKEPRPGERYFGHFDHVSTLQIAANNIDRNHDPFPNLPIGISARTHLIKPQAYRSSQQTVANDGLDTLATKMARRRR